MVSYDLGIESLIIVKNTAKVRKMAMKQNKFKTDRIMTGKIVEIIT